VNVTTWEEFCRAPGVTDVEETLEAGPTLQAQRSKIGDGPWVSEIVPIDPSLIWVIKFNFDGFPCERSQGFSLGCFTDPEWLTTDPHTAIVNTARAQLVEWVSRPGWPKFEEENQ